MPNATDLLRNDHMKVKELFRQFDSAATAAERKGIADTAILELDIHSRLEEEIFYPAVRRLRQGGQETEEMMNEADEEHHVVSLLGDELMRMRPEDPEFAAKFTVLAENVEHHIEEEESEILPQAEALGADRLEQLGMQMEQRKQQLMTAPDGSRTRSPSRSRANRTTSTRSSGAHRSRTGKPSASRSGSRSGSGSRSRKTARRK